MLGWKKRYPALLPSNTLLKDPGGRATTLPFSPITPTLPGGNATVRPLLLSGKYLLLITPVTT